MKPLTLTRGYEKTRFDSFSSALPASPPGAAAFSAKFAELPVSAILCVLCPLLNLYVVSEWASWGAGQNGRDSVSRRIIPCERVASSASRNCRNGSMLSNGRWIGHRSAYLSFRSPSQAFVDPKPPWEKIRGKTLRTLQRRESIVWRTWKGLE